MGGGGCLCWLGKQNTVAAHFTSVPLCQAVLQRRKFLVQRHWSSLIQSCAFSDFCSVLLQNKDGKFDYLVYLNYKPILKCTQGADSSIVLVECELFFCGVPSFAPAEDTVVLICRVSRRAAGHRRLTNVGKENFMYCTAVFKTAAAPRRKEGQNNRNRPDALKLQRMENRNKENRTVTELHAGWFNSNQLTGCS